MIPPPGKEKPAGEGGLSNQGRALIDGDSLALTWESHQANPQPVGRWDDAPGPLNGRNCDLYRQYYVPNDQDQGRCDFCREGLEGGAE